MSRTITPGRTRLPLVEERSMENSRCSATSFVDIDAASQSPSRSPSPQQEFDRTRGSPESYAPDMSTPVSIHNSRRDDIVHSHMFSTTSGQRKTVQRESDKVNSNRVSSQANFRRETEKPKMCRAQSNERQDCRSNRYSHSSREKQELRSRHYRHYSSPPTHRAHKQEALKLPLFDGETSLKTFLLKYDNCKRFNQWSETEAVAHLRNCLIKSAGSVLWILDETCSEEELITALENRYGVSQQCEKYQQMIRSRKQGKNETLEQVFADISEKKPI